MTAAMLLPWSEGTNLVDWLTLAMTEALRSISSLSMRERTWGNIGVHHENCVLAV